MSREDGKLHKSNGNMCFQVFVYGRDEMIVQFVFDCLWHCVEFGAGNLILLRCNNIIGLN